MLDCLPQPKRGTSFKVRIPTFCFPEKDIRHTKYLKLLIVLNDQCAAK